MERAKRGEWLHGCVVGLCLVALFFSAPVSAGVTGVCSNCHTMHNSQGGVALSGQANATLLVSECVGCHSSSTGETIVTLGTSRIPIVYNTTGYPFKPLAGGNFYYVASAGGNQDTHGHNVYGISDEDGKLVAAPMDMWGAGCTNSCHQSLAKPKSSMTGTNFDGCLICHQKVKHHGSTVADGELQTEASGWYRFLGGHSAEAGGFDVWPTAYVNGIEDADWEQNPAPGRNNRYLETLKGGNDYSFLQNEHSMSAFCIGCHARAHFATLSPNNVWLRHPTMIPLPSSGEFAAYDPVTDYDGMVSVGWVNPTTPARSEAVVMCLSCHRAHGSEYPDMLRWDYSALTAGAGESNEGCFKCHSTKDS